MPSNCIGNNTTMDAGTSFLSRLNSFKSLYHLIMECHKHTFTTAGVTKMCWHFSSQTQNHYWQYNYHYLPAGKTGTNTMTFYSSKYVQNISGIWKITHRNKWKGFKTPQWQKSGKKCPIVQFWYIIFITDYQVTKNHLQPKTISRDKSFWVKMTMAIKLTASKT